MNYAKKMARGSFIVLSFNILAAVLGYFLRILLSRNLSITDFGLFYSILAFLGFVAIFARLGLDSALVRLISEFNVKNKQKVSKIAFQLTILMFFFHVVAFLPFLVFSNEITIVLFHKANGLVFGLLILSTIVSSLIISLRSIFQSLGKIFEMAVIEFLRLIVIFILIFVFGINLNLVAYFYLISSVVVFFVLLIPNLNIFKISFLEKHVLLSAFVVGMPIFIASFGLVILNYTDTILLAYFRSMKDVAIYQVALPTARLITHFIVAITTIMFPLFVDMYVKYGKEKISVALNRLMKISMLLTAPIAVLFISFPDIIIRILFGGKYIDAVLALQWLSVSTFIFLVYMLSYTTLISIGKQKLTMKIVLCSSGLNFFMNLIFIPYFGIIGAVASTIISQLFMSVVSCYFVNKHIAFSVPFVELLKIFLACTFAVFSISIVKFFIEIGVWNELIITSIIGLVVYIIILKATKCLTNDDFDILKSIGIPVCIINFVRKVLK